ncbi:MFS transporter [Candidatus Bathyarchaeota archaeon]|nr:MFS transporter [Candidatus Bathyarchaeota archaeon]
MNRDLRLLFVSNLIGSFGDGLYAYLLPIYIQTALHADPVDVGALYTVLTLSAALTPIPGGYLAERYDWKKIMIFAWVLWLPIPLIFSSATHWTMLFPAMLLYGCFISGPSTTAYIASTARKDKINLTFTLISSAWWMGYIFSPSIGGYLATKVGMKVVFYMAFVFYTAATLVLLFIKSQRKETERQLKVEESKVSVDMKTILGWIVLFALIMFFNVLMRPFVPTFLKDIYRFDEFTIGVLGSFTFAGSAILGILVGRLGDKFGNKVALAVCLVFTTFSLSVFQFTSNFALLAPLFFLMGTNYTPWALMNATISSLSPESLRGRWVAISQTASMLAAFFAPYLGGTLYDISPNYPFIVTVTGISTLLITLCAYSFLSQWKNMQ